MIRLATPDDATAIAAIHLRSTQVDDYHYLAEELSDNSSNLREDTLWTRIIKERPQDVAVFEHPSGLVGFVCLSPSQDEDAEPGTGELTGIYLDPSFWGKDIAQGLMNWAKQTALAYNWHKMTLWVLKENEQARSFYRTTGWQPDGTVRMEAFGDETLTEMRYSWICDL